MAKVSALLPFLFEHAGIKTTSVRVGQQVENEERKSDSSSSIVKRRPEIHDDDPKLEMSERLLEFPDRKLGCCRAITVGRRKTPGDGPNSGISTEKCKFRLGIHDDGRKSEVTERILNVGPKF